MKPLTTALALALILASCGKREVTASESRPPTMRDENLNLDATPDQRFGQGALAPGMDVSAPPGQSPLIPSFVPVDWKEEEGNSFRLINFSFGEGGEVYLSTSGGTTLENVNRWLGQFRSLPLDSAAMTVLEQVQLPGFRGVWVEAEGVYESGMGQPPRDDYALRGVVARGPEGVLTVKMVGPAAEVAEQEQNLRQFVASLKPAN